MNPTMDSGAPEDEITQPVGDRGSRIRIEDVCTIDAFTRVRALEAEVWALEPLDVLPLTMLVATRAVGAILLGAYDGDALVGFVYGFPGIEGGRTTIHSHMLAVRQGYRDLDLGYRLKVAQRERARALGVSEVTWTFDPMQSRNAHFNFGKLGVVADSYRVDFYGTECSSFLLRDSTDRLWVRWFLESDRVCRRIDAREPATTDPVELGDAAPLVDARADGTPWTAEGDEVFDQERLRIHIPDDISAIHAENVSLAAAWRLATRRAFTAALDRGYVVEVFARSDRAARGYRDYPILPPARRACHQRREANNEATAPYQDPRNPGPGVFRQRDDPQAVRGRGRRVPHQYEPHPA